MPHGERRHLTVLFCDLVGSTEISSHLDPEQWREIVGGYHRAAAQAIERFGGHVAQFLGDGVMAYFGYPKAHDNEAERAARAGLAILDAISKLNENDTRPKLSGRVGIDSGAVVVGTGAGGDADVFGDTPNIAARAQAAAAPSTLLVTAATHRLVSGLFVVEDRGAHALKGIERPVQLYRVVRSSGLRGRLEAVAASRGLTSFVGREHELRVLMNRWERAVDGEGQVAFIIGEAGIGKSRLLQRFHERIGKTPHIWTDASAAPLYQNTPFYPIVEILRQFLDLRGDESAEEQLSKFEKGLKIAGLKLTEALPIIAPLLNQPVPEQYRVFRVAPEEQRRRLFTALVDWVLGIARTQPTIVVTEDLHWADPSTLELIQLLVDQGATSRLLLLYTARPEFRAPWIQRGHHTQLSLSRLSAGNVRRMMEEAGAHKAVSKQIIGIMTERAGGVPLFVEELTRAVLEGGPGLIRDEIPSTLHDSLMARLDRLGQAKEVLQVCAVIGGKFSYELLHAVYSKDDDNLQRALRKLVDAELLYVRGIAPDATYRFKHALIRDAAYQSLLKSVRQLHHERIARNLETRFAEKGQPVQPELLAHHFTEAGLVMQAVPFWQQAGQKAVERSANLEAISHLKKGLELVENLPRTAERAHVELQLLTTLGTPVVATQGYGAQEVAGIYTRARERCIELDNTHLLFPVLRGLWAFHLTRANYHVAYELATEFLTLAQRGGDSGLMVEAHFLAGFTLQFLGEFCSARTHCDKGMALYDPKVHRALAFSFGVDPGVNCLSCAPLAVWSLGYPDEALNRSREALSLAEELNHPFSSGWALIAATWFRQYRLDEIAVEKQANSAIALATDHGFPLWSAWAMILHGWAMSTRGRAMEGVKQICEGLKFMRAAGAELARTHFLGLLAESYGRGGKRKEALASLGEAFMLVDKTGERFYEAELYRLKGELLLMGDRPNVREAECFFGKAIETARKQSAKSLELRATTSLVRAFAKQGRRDDARTMLAEIYSWFTEGFETADLKEAKALLDELSG